jgi:tRNA-splicing ligase RtcB
MPIGGVIACEAAIIPYAVGVDIGCGIVAVRTDTSATSITKTDLRSIVDKAGRFIPTGEGHSHRSAQKWEHFNRLPGWLDKRGRELAANSLGTLGGGNHFMEVQEGDDGFIWLMIHSGSRNIGYRIANHHHKVALKHCRNHREVLPTQDLSFLPVESNDGRSYIKDMEFALDYALENRKRLMESFKEIYAEVINGARFCNQVNIHHNYAALENHFGRDVWVHRKGATSANMGQEGIIPGSMGTHSYIVQGLGNPDSFCSCSHGAGRVMGRREASRKLTVGNCNAAMKDVVFSGWKKYSGFGKRKKGAPLLDLSEAPDAYKNIDEVMEAQKDLVKPLVRLRPLGVVKG